MNGCNAEFWMIKAPNGDLYRFYDLDKAKEKFKEFYPNKILVDIEESEAK